MKENEQKNNIPKKDEKLNLSPGLKPFTKYRAAELIVCGVAVILGLLYLYAEIVTLAFLLPVYCAAFAAITVLRYFDAKAVGGHGFAVMLPVFCWGLLTAAVIAATAAYFMQ